MSSATSTSAGNTRSAYLQPDFIWSLALFCIAMATIVVLGGRQGLPESAAGLGEIVFFVAFGIFTIAMGYPHPSFGHVSFDRVAQVASLLVFGPLDAAWINGLASLIYPWHRLWLGVPLVDVITASLHNSGLMTLVILGCGTLYVWLGGAVPLVELNIAAAGPLLALLLSMQVANDAGMLMLLYLKNLDPSRLLGLFTSAVEIGSGTIAVLVAIVFVRMEMTVLALLLIVLSLGMLVLKQFAVMRGRLERLVEDRTEELRLKSIELERQATHDTLTGLYNRRYADDFVKREIDVAARTGRDVTVAIADIDRFKRINDTYSHAVGDDVLRRVSRVLRNHCRKTDVLARYGGEEFLLCFPGTGTEFAEQLCGQMRASVEQMQWDELGGAVPADFGITISFGVAAAEAGSRFSAVLGAADSRLYAAKAGGRNRVVGPHSEG